MQKHHVILNSVYVGDLSQQEYDALWAEVRSDRRTTLSSVFHSFRPLMQILYRVAYTTPLFAFWALVWLTALESWPADTPITTSTVAVALQFAIVGGLLGSLVLIMFSTDLDEIVGEPPRAAHFKKLVRQKLRLHADGDLVVVSVE